MSAEFSVKAVVQAVDRFSGPYGKMLSGATRFTRRFDAFASRVLSAPGRMLTRIGEMARGVKAITAAGGAIIRFAQSYTQGADAISKAARRIGLSTDAYQEYRFAAGLAGASTQEFDKSVEKFAKNLGELKATGQGTLATFLKKADPAFLRMIKSTESTEEALDQVILAFGEIEDPTERAALAQAAFGRSGQKMTLLMENGADALRDAKKQAHDYGAVIDKEALAKTEKFNDSISRMGSFVGGFKNIVGATLIEALQPELEKIERWIRENPERVRELARQIGEGLAKALEAVVNAFRWVIDHKEIILGFFGALVAVKIINGVAALATSFKSILGSVLGIGKNKGLLGFLAGVFGGGGGVVAGAAAGAAARGGAAAGAAEGAAATAGGASLLTSPLLPVATALTDWGTSDPVGPARMREMRDEQMKAAAGYKRQQNMLAAFGLPNYETISGDLADTVREYGVRDPSVQAIMDQTRAGEVIQQMAGAYMPWALRSGSGPDAGPASPQELVVTVKAAAGTDATVATGPGTNARIKRETGVSPVGRGDGTIP